MRALVVNCSVDVTGSNRSREYYNLGAEKLANYLRRTGYEVTRAAGDPGMFMDGYDLICLSAIFSWHVLTARDAALRAKETGAKVWVGGPAFTDLRGQFEEWTGIKPVWKPDPRFDREPGDYKMIYAVRGCAGETLDDGPPLPCAWCRVPKVEGTVYVLNPDFPPAPTLLDNNPSGMPVRMQEHIIARYLESGVRLEGINSGFEPGKFDAATRERWDKALRGPWRWGFDVKREESNAKEMAGLLSDVSMRRKLVYCMCGNESIATCYERAQKVIEWGCEPYVQFMIPESALDFDDVTTWAAKDRPGQRKCKADGGTFTDGETDDWTRELGRAFSRYYISKIYKTTPIWNYEHNVGWFPFRHLQKVA